MGDDDLTDKQRNILKTKKKNPDLSNEEIAVKTDSSASYVSQVLNEYDESDLGGGNGGLILILLLLLVGGYILATGGGSSESLLVFAASTTKIKYVIRQVGGKP